MKKTAIAFITILSLGVLSPVYADDGSRDDVQSCPVVPPVIQTVYVDKIVYVDKPVPGPTVYVDRNVPGPTVYVNVPVPGPTVYVNVPVPGTTVYVDKPVVETQTVTVPGPVTQVQVPVENPVNVYLQSQVNTLKSKYAKLLKSYTLLHKHEVKEKAKYFSGNK